MYLIPCGWKFSVWIDLLEEGTATLSGTGPGMEEGTGTKCVCEGHSIPLSLGGGQRTLAPSCQLGLFLESLYCPHCFATRLVRKTTRWVSPVTREPGKIQLLVLIWSV